MQVLLFRRVKFQEKLDAVRELYIILCNGDPGDEMSMLQGLASDGIAWVTVCYNFKRSAKLFVLAVQVGLRSR